MRVLHVAESVKGGCGTYLNEVVPEQRKDPTIAALRVIVPAAHAHQVSSIPGNVLTTFQSDQRSVKGLWALTSVMLREIRHFRPDVVHLHSTFAGLIGRSVLGWGRSDPRIV